MSKSSYECPGTTVVCVSRMLIYNFSPVMAKPLINGITLAIVLTKQKINNKKVEPRKSITFCEPSFPQEKQKSRDKWILEQPVYIM